MKTTGTNPDIEILYEDNHLLAVNKPAGILSQEDHTGKPDLLSLCKEYLRRDYNKKGNVFLGLLHRLDQPVGGVMLFAKTSKAASRINEQIRNRTIKKIYLAIVEGSPPKNGLLRDYLLKDPRTNTVSVVSSDTKNAQKAELIYQVTKKVNGLSLIKITLITGRPHQIRVQFSHLGYPILNDQKYSSKHRGAIALFASELTFNHPTHKKEMTIGAMPASENPWNLIK